MNDDSIANQLTNPLTMAQTIANEHNNDVNVNMISQIINDLNAVYKQNYETMLKSKENEIKQMYEAKISQLKMEYEIKLKEAYQSNMTLIEKFNQTMSHLQNQTKAQK